MLRALLLLLHSNILFFYEWFQDAALVEHLEQVEASHFQTPAISTVNQELRWGNAVQQLHPPSQPQSHHSAVQKSIASLDERISVHSRSSHPHTSDPDHRSGIQRASWDAVVVGTTSSDIPDEIPRDALTHHALESTFGVRADPRINETDAPENGQWVCRTCTLYNSASARWCEVCRAAAPTQDGEFKSSGAHIKA